MITPFHAMFFANEWMRRGGNGLDRSMYCNARGDINGLWKRLAGFCRITLRKDVETW